MKVETLVSRPVRKGRMKPHISGEMFIPERTFKRHIFGVFLIRRWTVWTSEFGVFLCPRVSSQGMILGYVFHSFPPSKGIVLGHVSYLKDPQGVFLRIISYPKEHIMHTGGLPIMPDIRSLKKGCHLLLEATFNVWLYPRYLKIYIQLDTVYRRISAFAVAVGCCIYTYISSNLPL